MNLHHHLAHLHCGSAEDAKTAMHIEECLEAQREELQEDILNKVENAETYRVFPPCTDTDFQELNEALNSAIFDLPEIERKTFLDLYTQYVALHVQIAKAQKDINTSIEKVKDELK